MTALISQCEKPRTIYRVNENLHSPHKVVKYDNNSNGTKKNKMKKYNSNAMSILV